MADSEIKTIGQALQTKGFFKWSTKPAECEIHGAFTSTEYPSGWSRCEECANADRAAEFAVRRLEDERKEQEYRLIEAGIPKRFRDCSLDTYVPSCDSARVALNLATAYANEFAERRESGTCLIFCGTVGTGKTHLAVGIVKRVLDQRRRALFASVIGAVSSVKATYSRDSELTEQQAIDQFLHPDLLVLDEVGAQFGSDAEKLILFRIINGRYERVLPTIIVSNLAKDLLGESIGERSLDRLRENGGRLVAFDWASHRRQAVKEQA